MQSIGRRDKKDIADSRKQKPRTIDLPHKQREFSIASWPNRQASSPGRSLGMAQQPAKGAGLPACIDESERDFVQPDRPV
jgi:hypothetical protein